MQLYAPQMADGAATARRHADTQIIINHTGMPLDRDPEGLAGLAQRHAGARRLPQRRRQDLGPRHGRSSTGPWSRSGPFVLETIDMFGTDRCLFASNFPVDRLFSDYATVWRAFDQITGSFSEEERSGLFHDNAERIYRL